MKNQDHLHLLNIGGTWDKYFRLTRGTVHALQGAERLVILFSSYHLW
jgi:hypothetical protein